MIHLSLEIKEVESIMQALGNGPYVQVADLIQKVREQALPQVNTPPQVEPVTSDFGNAVVE